MEMKKNISKKNTSKKTTSKNLKDLRIADRGLKFNLTEKNDQINLLKKVIFGLIMAVITSSIISYILLDNRKYFLLQENGRPITLSELRRIPLTKSRIISFTDEAIDKIYGLNFRFIKQQLKSSKLYLADNTYQKIMNELKRSNYIQKIEAKKAIITIIPTPTIFKFEMIDRSHINVWRTYMREEISGDNIYREEITMKIVVKEVKMSDMHPWGLVIKSIKEEEVKNF
jgi:hypothetical protein